MEKEVNRVNNLSIREYKKLEREVKYLRKQNEELQDLLEGIFSNEKIIAKKKMEEYNGKKCGGGCF